MRREGRRRMPRRDIGELTPREDEVARLIACGMDNSEIAEALGATLSTAGYHAGLVKGKLEARNSRHLVVVCIEYVEAHQSVGAEV